MAYGLDDGTEFVIANPEAQCMRVWVVRCGRHTFSSRRRDEKIAFADGLPFEFASKITQRSTLFHIPSLLRTVIVMTWNEGHIL
jgi:hypothetical protein